MKKAETFKRIGMGLTLAATQGALFYYLAGQDLKKVCIPSAGCFDITSEKKPESTFKPKR